VSFERTLDRLNMLITNIANLTTLQTSSMEQQVNYARDADYQLACLIFPRELLFEHARRTNSKTEGELVPCMVDIVIGCGGGLEVARAVEELIESLSLKLTREKPVGEHVASRAAVELYKKFTRTFSLTWERMMLDTHKLSLSAAQATEQIRVAADVASTKLGEKEK